MSLCTCICIIVVVAKDYFRCFRGWEKGFGEKTSCESKCLFATYRWTLPAFHFCTFDHSELLFFISESILRITFPDKNGSLYTQEKSEILENIIKIACWIQLFCDVYYILQTLALRAVIIRINKWARLPEAENHWIRIIVWLFLSKGMTFSCKEIWLSFKSSDLS